MKSIHELIAELCPNGVEYKTIGDVVRIKNGKDYKHLEPGNIPVYGSGGVMTHVNQAIASGPTVLIPRKGSLGNLYFVDGDFWTVDTIFYTEISESLHPKFFYYSVARLDIASLNTAGGVPSLTQRVLNQLKVPVPPLEVQQEIVRILDEFTQLQAELEAELEARRQQYEYYRDQLLTFPEIDGGGYSLKQLCVIQSGWGFPKNLQGKKYGIPFYKVSDMNLPGNEVTMTKSNNYVSFADIEVMRAGIVPAGAIVFPKIGAAIGTNKKRILALEAGIDNNLMAICVKERSLLDPKFLFYVLQQLDLTSLANDSGAVPSIRKGTVEDLTIPAIPLTEQERIVNILDKFEALVNDLTSGLPAEIEARRQQYEYYRDQLLDFPELKA